MVAQAALTRLVYVQLVEREPFLFSVFS